MLKGNSFSEQNFEIYIHHQTDIFEAGYIFPFVFVLRHNLIRIFHIQKLTKYTFELHLLLWNFKNM